MNHKPQQYRVALVPVNELVLVRFLAEVKMGAERVLEKMDEKVTEQDQECSVAAAQFETGGNHFHERGRQHESRAQSHEIAQITTLPVPLDDDRAAENVSSRGGKTEDNAGKNRAHWPAIIAA